MAQYIGPEDIAVPPKKLFSRTQISPVTDRISLCCGDPAVQPCIPYTLTMGPPLRQLSIQFAP